MIYYYVTLHHYLFIIMTGKDLDTSHNNTKSSNKSSAETQNTKDPLLLHQKKHAELQEELENFSVLFGEEKCQKILELYKKIQYCNIEYYNNSNSVITDTEYDKLWRDFLKKREAFIQSFEERTLSLSKELDKIRDILNKTPQYNGKQFNDFYKTKETAEKCIQQTKSITSRVGSGTVDTRFKKITHTKPMLSLSNSFSQQDISSFFIRTQRSLKKENQSYADLSVLCEPKIDGLSFSLRYINGKLKIISTRGDGVTGEDITHNKLLIANLPAILQSNDLPEDLEVRGEIYMTHDNFHKLNSLKKESGNKIFSNPRNAASGLMRRLQCMEDEHYTLNYFMYSVINYNKLTEQKDELLYLRKLGFCVNDHYKICHNTEEIIEYSQYILSIRDSLEYEIDGLVCKINDKHLQTILGNRERNPRWAIAHKFPAIQKTTKLLSIDVQVGRTGVLTPVANLQPISIGGVIVSRATLHNYAEIQRKDIRVGDTVIIQRAGDVIPQIISVQKNARPSDAENIQIPQFCPVCNGEIEILNNNTVIKCINDNCYKQIEENMCHFISKESFNIKGLGKQQLHKLMHEGLVKNPADLFTLESRNTRSIIENFDDWGQKSVDTLFTAIENSRTITFAKLLYSLGIQSVGTHVAKILSKKYVSPNNFLHAWQNSASQETTELLIIKGIGDKCIASLSRYMTSEKNISMIQDLLHYINVISDNTNTHTNNEKCILFTGTLTSMTRTQAIELSQKMGFSIGTTISKKINLLVAGQNAGSKLKKATELGIEIISEEAWLNLMKSPDDNIT